MVNLAIRCSLHSFCLVTGFDADDAVEERLTCVLSMLQALLMQAKIVQEAGITLSKPYAAVSPHRSPVPLQQIGRLGRALDTQEQGILQCQLDLALLSTAID